jgi:dienelactone hydrolase
MRYLSWLPWTAISVLAAVSSAHAQVEVKEITTRPGVTVRFIYAKAENAVASAVLFPGGSGYLDISPDGATKGDGSFITIGGAKRFNQNGINVLIPAIPSDRKDMNVGAFRFSAEHAQDNAALIEFLRQQSKTPVWAIGTSASALSAAAAAIHLKENGPDGIVLTSSVTSLYPKPEVLSVTSAPLDQIKVPVLIVHARKDVDCTWSTYERMPALVAAFTSSRKIEFLTVEGGFSMPKGNNPCATGFHQFNGVEDSVTKDIADWIKRN